MGKNEGLLVPDTVSTGEEAMELKNQATLGPPDTMALEVHGLLVGIAANSEMRDRLVPHLPAGWKRSDRFEFDRYYRIDGPDLAGRAYTLHAGPTLLAR